jgi:hypothetical protein
MCVVCVVRCPVMYTKGNLRLTSMMTQAIVEDSHHTVTHHHSTPLLQPARTTIATASTRSY